MSHNFMRVSEHRQSNPFFIGHFLSPDGVWCKLKYSYSPKKYEKIFDILSRRFFSTAVKLIKNLVHEGNYGAVWSC